MKKFINKATLISISIGLATAVLAFSLLYLFVPNINNKNGNAKSIFDAPKDSAIDIMTGDFINVSDIAADYKIKEESGKIFLKPTEPHLQISGFPNFTENGNIFYRLDYKNKSNFNVYNQELAWNTSGGRIRFKTNSAQIVINVTLHHYTEDFMHMPMTGVAGLDVYTGTGTNKKWLYTVFPVKGKANYTITLNLSGKMEEVCVNLPLYAGVKSIEFGFNSNAKIGTPTPYKYEKPVLFYGSSITQGGCSSRPGTSFPQLATRLLDANLINLGFSGSAYGEPKMAEYIAGLDMSVFVMDYDHNSADANSLKATHYEFYRIIREKNPNLPIIILSKSDVLLSDTDANAIRRIIVKQTYDKAIANGDKNVYFISGDTIYGDYYRDINMVDGCHPDDLGAYRYAEALYPVLKAALEKNK